MIKKILFSLGIIGLGFINFSSAVGSNQWGFLSSHLIGQYNLNQEYTIPSLTNSTFTLKDNANFYFSNDNVNGNFYYIQYKNSSNKYNNFLYFWNDNKLYIALQLNNSSDNVFTPGNYQGYFEYLCFVDNLLDTPDSTQVYCNVQSSGNPNVITVSDFINDSQFSNPDKLTFLNNGELYSLCFTYNDLGKSYCAGLYGRFTSSTAYYTAGNLISSSAFPSDIYNQSYITCSPWGCPSGGNDSGIGTGINLQCTKQSALNWYNKNGYDDRLCYGGYDDFVINDGTPLGYLPYWGTGLDFEEIWLETANLRQGGTTGSATDLYPWFTYWRAMYDLYKRGGFDVNPFLNTPWVLFSYFGVIDIYGHTFLSKDIIEYCDLLLYTSDYSVGYSGSNVDNVCTRSNLLDDYYSNLSGDNLNIGIDINGSGENITDGTDFINKYWAVLRENFGNAVENTDGVLPLYIQLALIGLILFRFISH